MSGKEKNLDNLLDQALAEIRDEPIDPRIEKAAADSVWQQIDAELTGQAHAESEQQLIRSCTDFQAMVPAYIKGEVPAARALLFKDHVNECVSCRKSLKQARSGRRVVAPARASASERSLVSRWGWKIAVAAAITVALVGLDWQSDVFSIKTGGLITIESVEGEVFEVTNQGSRPLQPGDQISFQDVSGIRTAKGSGATLRLEDDSLVEMNERAELAVYNQRKPWNRGRGDAVLDLRRGNIIVEAADQNSDHLYVDTDDCRVAVTGTVFAVSSGVKGSRVSVIEGSVEVSDSDRRRALRPGQQTTTSQGLGPVPIESEIAWSRNLDRHLALLHEMARVSGEIDEAIEGPGLRYDTGMIDVLPPRTVVYIGIPNVSDAVTKAYDMLQEKIESNELVSQWWDESVREPGIDDELATVMDKIRSYGGHIGDEIAVTLQFDEKAHDKIKEPLILAPVRDAAEFRAFLEAEIVQLEEGDDIRLLPRELNLYLPSLEEEGLFVWVGEKIAVVSPDLDQVRAAFSTIEGTKGTEFTSGAFHRQLSDQYGNGVEWVIGVDIATIYDLSGARDPGKLDETLEKMGFLDLQHLIAEHKDLDDGGESRVVLSFGAPRHGMAAWLAEPAPMGALDFVSAKAHLAAGFVMEEPATMLEQLIELVGSSGVDLEQQLDDFEAEHGIDIREDLAAALGGEFALAIDGPILPKPAWKLIFEVYDPAQLQSTLEWAVGRLNRFAEEHGALGLAIEQQAAGDRIYYELKSLDTGLSAHYVFVDGYVVAGMSRTLLKQAIQTRDLGIGLVHSERFRSLMPRDGHINFSGVVFQDLGAILGPLFEHAGEAASRLNPQQQQMFEDLGKNKAPSLIAAYGEANRITVVNTSRERLLGTALRTILSLDSLANVQQLLGQAAASAGAERSRPDVHDRDDRAPRGMNEG